MRQLFLRETLLHHRLFHLAAMRQPMLPTVQMPLLPVAEQLRCRRFHELIPWLPFHLQRLRLAVLLQHRRTFRHDLIIVILIIIRTTIHLLRPLNTIRRRCRCSIPTKLSRTIAPFVFPQHLRHHAMIHVLLLLLLKLLRGELLLLFHPPYPDATRLWMSVHPWPFLLVSHSLRHHSILILEHQR
jgi:hypothetical protein